MLSPLNIFAFRHSESSIFFSLLTSPSMVNQPSLGLFPDVTLKRQFTKETYPTL